MTTEENKKLQAKHTPQRAVYFFVFDGFADWEPSHALAELRRHGRYRVEVVSLTRTPVLSMGGLRVLPSLTIGEVDPADVAVFILPGGDRWEMAAVEGEVEQLLKRLDAQEVPIAAICAATVAISRIGLLRGRRHTSNGLDYLRSHVPGYSESAHYVDAPATRDRRLITASGLADVEFARELFEELNVLTADDRGLWARMFRTAQFPGTLYVFSKSGTKEVGFQERLFAFADMTILAFSICLLANVFPCNLLLRV